MVRVMGDDHKRRWPREVAVGVAREVCSVLGAVCDRLIVAGSLRRRRAEVGDVEILYIGKTEERADPEDMFAEMTVDLADEAILGLEAAGVLERRLNSRGNETYGKLNKLMRHVRTGVPVDLFSTSEAAWWNYLVCRTGPAESNMRIATRAKNMGYRWSPYGAGFEDRAGGRKGSVGSEREVFAFVGLDFREPWER